MSSTLAINLIDFRNSIYLLLLKRKDAIMNLLDAASSHGHHCKSVVQLSTAPCFERQYSSITDAIADGLSEASWEEIKKLCYKKSKCDEEETPNHFIIDCTPNPRPYAKKLVDRHVTHAPNPAPGNKPICIGHQYSVIVSSPANAEQKAKKWVRPLSAERVPSQQKGNEFGMQQLSDYIDDLEINDKLNICVTDSLYGTDECRKIAAAQENLVHIFRLRNNRNIFFAPTKSENLSGKGRGKEFGSKMQLGDVTTHRPCDTTIDHTVITRKGATHIVTINCWNDMLLRGSRKFRSCEHPINLIQITVTNEQGEKVFQRPLWLGVLGKRRKELSLMDIQQAYAERYDIEHFFRFGKQNLLMDASQTADSQHEELWWKFCCLAYMQLYLASGVVPSMPQPWERYLPEFKEVKEQEKAISSPSKTQRGFANVLETIGTPAATCVARGKPVGRMSGDVQVKKETQPVMFKTKKTTAKTNLSTSELTDNSSDSKKIKQLVDTVQTSLKKLNLTPSEFSKLLVNSS